jgi:hypothetical protein
MEIPKYSDYLNKVKSKVVIPIVIIVPLFFIFIILFVNINGLFINYKDNIPYNVMKNNINGILDIDIPNNYNNITYIKYKEFSINMVNYYLYLKEIDIKDHNYMTPSAGLILFGNNICKLIISTIKKNKSASYSIKEYSSYLVPQSDLVFESAISYNSYGTKYYKAIFQDGANKYYSLVIESKNYYMNIFTIVKIDNIEIDEIYNELIANISANVFN